MALQAPHKDNHPLRLRQCHRKGQISHGLQTPRWIPQFRPSEVFMKNCLRGYSTNFLEAVRCLSGIAMGLIKLTRQAEF
jgi:hypothetical protein